jgi:quercetin dioxygenase-like cupin family protein
MTSTTTTIIPADRIEHLWVLTDRVSLLGALPGTATHLIEVEIPPGSGTPPHTHASPELFRVTEGEVTFGLFGDGPPRESTLGPGGVAAIGPHTAHNYTNRGPRPARMTVMLDATMIAFFRDLGRPEAPPPGPPSEAAIAAVMAACARHGIAMLPAPAPV